MHTSSWSIQEEAMGTQTSGSCHVIAILGRVKPRCLEGDGHTDLWLLPCQSNSWQGEAQVSEGKQHRCKTNAARAWKLRRLGHHLLRGILQACVWFGDNGGWDETILVSWDGTVLVDV
jgi:hypothetical protein